MSLQNLVVEQANHLLAAMALTFDKNKKYSVVLDETGEVIATKCNLAVNFMTRLIGLMFRTDMNVDEALLIIPCNSVHTFFMRFTLDLILIDSDGNVVHEEKEMLPGRLLKPVHNAWAALELKGGRLGCLESNRSLEGMKIRFEPA